MRLTCGLDVPRSIQTGLMEIVFRWVDNDYDFDDNDDDKHHHHETFRHTNHMVI
jgi:hypothetical protein